MKDRSERDKAIYCALHEIVQSVYIQGQFRILERQKGVCNPKIDPMTLTPYAPECEISPTLDKCAEAIQALDASAWRPVSEPPEMEDRNGTGYLESVCVQTIDAEGCQLTAWSWSAPDGHVFWTQAGRVSTLISPTHWRPLPEGPK